MTAPALSNRTRRWASKTRPTLQREDILTEGHDSCPPPLSRRDWLRLATAGALAPSISGWFGDLASTQAKLEALYLAALARKPTAKELSRMGAHVEKAGGEALADVFWVLLNSSEFKFNH